MIKMLNRYARSSDLWRRTERLAAVRETITGISQRIGVHDSSYWKMALGFLQTSLYTHTARFRLALWLLYRIRQLLRLHTPRRRKSNKFVSLTPVQSGFF